MVIAVIDTGMQPYLPVFDVNDDSYTARAIPASLTRVEIARNGSPQTRFDMDAAEGGLLESLQAGVLYHYAGTRLLGISFEPGYKYVTIDGYGHGIGTTYIAARDAPNAIILSIQVNANGCGGVDPLCHGPTVADAMEWVADQPWIDIISISIVGSQVNAPDNSALHEEVGRQLAASQRIVASGKIIVNGAGNYVIPSLMDYFNGPPWIIAAGGFDVGQGGETLAASKGVDVVSSFVEIVPDYYRIETTRTGHGTSYSTPLIAATLAEALHIIRERDPTLNVSVQQLRDAMNASATFATPVGWNPIPPPDPDSGLPVDPFRITLPVVTQPQMGWGFVNASLAPEIARRVIEQDHTLTGKDQAAQFQPVWQQTREKYWAHWK